MKRFSRREFVLGSVLVLLGVLCVYLILRDAPVCRAGSGTGKAGTDWPVDVRIEGDVVSAISPGVMVPLDLKFTNTHHFDVSITSLSVAVSWVEAPNADDTHACLIDDFAVEQARSDLRITVAARTTNTLSGLGVPSVMWPRMGMLNRPINQDGCKGASLTLAYTASGTGETP